MNNNVEQIKNKLDIVEVIRDYIAVKQAGTNFKAVCPFHNEKNPSLVISPAKQIWHCFGCGKGGDVFTFVMEKEGLDFAEALRMLAAKAGVVLEQFNSKKSSERQRLVDLMALAASHFHQLLLDAKEAEAGRKYLSERGLDDETISEWQIGYSSAGWDDLTKYAQSKGYQARELIAAGLAVTASGSSRIYDRFRGRVMFPINDHNGHTVGFSARILPGREDQDKMGKYVNSPDTPLYNKSKLLFGLDKAKSAVRNLDQAIIVEGQLDCITAHQFGFKNVVASSGTALTLDQAALLERLTDNVVFALDADPAGQAATERASEIFDQLNVKTVEALDNRGETKTYIDPAKSFKKSLRVAILPHGKDPDECIRQDKEGWVNAIDKAVPILQFYFDRVLADLDLTMVDNKKKAAAKLLPFIAKLDNPLDKGAWLKYLAEKLEVDQKYLVEALDKFARPKSQVMSARERVAPVQKVQLRREELLSQQLLALVMHFPAQINYLVDYIMPEHLAGAENQNLYKNLVIYYTQGSSSQESKLGHFLFNYRDFKTWLLGREELVTGHLEALVMLGERDFASYDPATADIQIKTIIKQLKQAYLSERLRAVSRLIGEMEADPNVSQQELASLLTEFSHLSRELAEFLN